MGILLLYSSKNCRIIFCMMWNIKAFLKMHASDMFPRHLGDMFKFPKKELNFQFRVRET